MDLIRKEIEEYCIEHTSPESPLLARINRETHLSQVYPRMLSGHLQGTLLRMISSMLKPRRILEIGTFTGYSAINLAEELTSDGILHTIDVDPELEPIVNKYITDAGLQDKVKMHIGQAEEIIPDLNEKWDIVFIDADKPNYLKYYKMVIADVRPGGFILADNALWDGKVIDPDTSNKDAIGIREFNEYIQSDPQVENLLLPFRDGLMIIQKVEG